MYLLAILCTLIVFPVVILVRWRKKTFEYFENIGIPGPEPNIIWGNLLEYHRNGRDNALKRWYDKYGKIFGFYNGDVPTLVVSDIDFLNYVFFTNFKNFVERGITMRSDQEHSFLGQAMVHAKEPQWRILRSITSKEFTSYKLKRMMPYLVEQGDIFMDVLGQLADEGRQASMDDAFQALSLDFVCRAAFGMETDFQHNLACPFYVKAKNIVPGMMKGFFHAVAQSSTTLGKVMKPFFWLNKILGNFSMEIFAREMNKVVKLRTQNEATRQKDMLQNLEAEVHAIHPNNGMTLKNKNNSESDKLENAGHLSEEEVVLLTTVLLVGSFQTTSVTLGFISLLLAMHSEIQEKVRREVKAAIESSDYDTVIQKLKYTRQVINETLRLYPPSVTFHTRTANESFMYKNKTFKAGTCIMAPVLQLHQDPDYWHEPSKFDPDRFGPENEGRYCKAAFQPFGIGPRSCVGYNLAVLQVLYFTARMVANFKTELGDAQKGAIAIHNVGMMEMLDNGPWIKFTRL
ncbi:unnamed protein product [Ixodes pacificus]